MEVLFVSFKVIFDYREKNKKKNRDKRLLGGRDNKSERFSDNLTACYCNYREFAFLLD